MISANTLIVEMVVADNYAIAKFDNDTYYTFLRPSSLGANATRSRTGLLQITERPEAIFTYYS